MLTRPLKEGEVDNNKEEMDMKKKKEEVGKDKGEMDMKKKKEEVGKNKGEMDMKKKKEEVDKKKESKKESKKKSNEEKEWLLSPLTVCLISLAIVVIFASVVAILIAIKMKMGQSGIQPLPSQDIEFVDLPLN